MSTPKTKVAIDAPIFVLICLEAQFPKAWDAPALLNSATITPRSTRKIKIPALPETAEINPSVVMASTVWMGLKFVAKSPPAKIPINSEE